MGKRLAQYIFSVSVWFPLLPFLALASWFTGVIIIKSYLESYIYYRFPLIPCKIHLKFIIFKLFLQIYYLLQSSIFISFIIWSIIIQVEA